MYHPTLVAARLDALLTKPPVRQILPDGFQLYTPNDVRFFLRRFALATAEDGTLTRPLTAEELRFTKHERLRCPVDFQYFAERYISILREGSGLAPLYPLWDSQRLVLEEISRRELAHWQAHHPDGIGFAVTLKARQLGVSTLAQSLVAHRCILTTHTAGLIAADVPAQSEYLLGMAERLYDHLPWYLRTPTKFRVKGAHFIWSNGSFLNVESGKSMRGQLQDEGGTKGELGRGKTYALAHLSELATWEHPEQLDTALFSGIPVSPKSLVILESTAKGRHNWWHHTWEKAVKGLDRFFPIFIPWYAERDKYWLPPPPDWSPSPTTLTHAARAEQIGPRYLHRPVSLTREQLYWYEVKRANFEHDDRLADFLAEYPAEPEESFQYSGRSIFPLLVRERIKSQARPIQEVLMIERWVPDQPDQVGA